MDLEVPKFVLVQCQNKNTSQIYHNSCSLNLVQTTGTLQLPTSYYFAHPTNIRRYHSQNPQTVLSHLRSESFRYAS